MRIALFEDAAVAGLTPIALTRPTFELRCGQFTLRERLARRFGFAEYGAYLRSCLDEVYREEHPQARVNDPLWLHREATLLVNGRWLPRLADLADIQPGDAGIFDDDVAYLTLDAEEALLLGDDWAEPLAKLADGRRKVAAGGKLVRHPWDLVNHNAEQLADDFQLCRYGRSKRDLDERVAIVGATDDVYIHRDAEVDPYVVIDSRGGPVSIDAGAIVQAFTRLEGPCHVSGGAQLFRANVREATTIGPVCRVGGEVEASILHGYANKYHDGFLGHSYVCPWVNLGALTTNSDLKNTYANVTVPLAGEPIDTGGNKAGCYLGDHTKTAIGSLFNTGTAVGVMSMILPADGLPTRHIPSFCRMWNGALDDGVNFDEALATARTAMSRRDCVLTPAMERLLRHLHQSTADERTAALDYAAARVERIQIPAAG